MAFAAVIETSEVIGLMLTLGDDDETYLIHGFKTEEEALAYFEKAYIFYNRNHGRGFEASMSAVMNYIQFRPTVIELDESKLDEYFPDKDTVPVRVHAVFGMMVLLPITPNELIDKAIAEGKVPSLIDGD